MQVSYDLNILTAFPFISTVTVLSFLEMTRCDSVYGDCRDFRCGTTAKFANYLIESPNKIWCILNFRLICAVDQEKFVRGRSSFLYTSWAGGTPWPLWIADLRSNKTNGKISVHRSIPYAMMVAFKLWCHLSTRSFACGWYAIVHMQYVPNSLMTR